MAEEKLQYPKARRCPCTIDKYQGDSVNDAYRWLEELSSEDVKTFITEQNALTRSVLSKCTFTDTIKTRLAELLDYTKYSCPCKQGNRYFYFKTDGSQDGGDLYMQKYVKGDTRVFLDYKILCNDGITSIVDYNVSPDGRIMAYSLSRESSYRGILQFKAIESKQIVPDVLENIQLSKVSWTYDSLGVFYVKYPDPSGTEDSPKPIPKQNGKIFYHRLNTVQSDDVLICEFPEHPQWRSEHVVSDCGKYLVNHVFQGPNTNSVYIASLDEKETQLNTNLEFIPLITDFEADFRYVTNEESVFFFHTNKDAPNYCVVGIEISDSNELTWITLIPADPHSILTRVMPVKNDKLLVTYMIDVKTVLQLRELKDGTLLKTFYTDMGNVSSFWAERKQAEFFFEASSFTVPKKLFHVDLNGLQEPKVFLTTKVKGIDPANIISTQIVYENEEKRKIPMFIVKNRTTIQNGNNPCLIYGFGGFGVSMSPTFNDFHLFFVREFNGIVAYPNIRGGGEYGTTWHSEGKRVNKQNSFNDFQAAAEFLIKNNYTNPNKLALGGSGHGGLLAAVCINQCPNISKAVIAQNGIMDMFRFHKFTLGYTWREEFGCSDDRRDFQVLDTYSPLHNVAMPDECQYPAVLLTAREENDLISPIHSYKFIAELQATIGQQPRQENALLIRIGEKTGNGAWISKDNQISEWTDIIAFLSIQLNLSMTI